MQANFVKIKILAYFTFFKIFGEDYIHTNIPSERGNVLWCIINLPSRFTFLIEHFISLNGFLYESANGHQRCKFKQTKYTQTKKIDFETCLWTKSVKKNFITINKINGL